MRPPSDEERATYIHIACPACGLKYEIPRSPLRSVLYRIKCKKCDGIIEIDPTV